MQGVHRGCRNAAGSSPRDRGKSSGPVDAPIACIVFVPVSFLRARGRGVTAAGIGVCLTVSLWYAHAYSHAHMHAYAHVQSACVSAHI
jgi:hypothetical protein